MAAKVTVLDLFHASLPANEVGLRVALIAPGVTPFVRSVNAAMLLQRLDVDGDPGNGIDLTGLDTALASASVDFELSNRVFQDALLPLAGSFESQVKDTFEYTVIADGLTAIAGTLGP